MAFNWKRFLINLVAATSQEVAVGTRSRKTRQVADFVSGAAALTKLAIEARKARDLEREPDPHDPYSHPEPVIGG